MSAINTYVGIIILYNSELWALTEKTCKAIDCVQRKFQREIRIVHWPKVTSNDKLYEKNKQEPWSSKVKRRALNWLGHLLRLDITAPARKYLNAFVQPCKRPPGRPKETWLSYIRQILIVHTNINNKDLKTMIQDLECKYADRNRWRTAVRNIKL